MWHSIFRVSHFVTSYVWFATFYYVITSNVTFHYMFVTFCYVIRIGTLFHVRTSCPEDMHFPHTSRCAGINEQARRFRHIWVPGPNRRAGPLACHEPPCCGSQKPQPVSTDIARIRRLRRRGTASSNTGGPSTGDCGTNMHPVFWWNKPGQQGFCHRGRRHHRRGIFWQVCTRVLLREGVYWYISLRFVSKGIFPYILNVTLYIQNVTFRI